MNSKISFKNSYSVIFAKQVQRGPQAVRKPPSVHWVHPRRRESLFNQCSSEAGGGDTRTFGGETEGCVCELP